MKVDSLGESGFPDSGNDQQESRLLSALVSVSESITVLVLMCTPSRLTSEVDVRLETEPYTGQLLTGFVFLANDRSSVSTQTPSGRENKL